MRSATLFMSHGGHSELLFHALAVKLLDFVERNDIHLVIQIGVTRAGDDQQLFVIASYAIERVFAE